MDVFWAVASCSVVGITDVPEVFIVPIIRVSIALQNMSTICAKSCHSKDSNSEFGSFSNFTTILNSETIAESE
jgi:hypothetical protein